MIKTMIMRMNEDGHDIFAFRVPYVTGLQSLVSTNQSGEPAADPIVYLHKLSLKKDVPQLRWTWSHC